MPVLTYRLFQMFFQLFCQTAGIMSNKMYLHVTRLQSIFYGRYYYLSNPESKTLPQNLLC